MRITTEQLQGSLREHSALMTEAGVVTATDDYSGWINLVSLKKAVTHLLSAGPASIALLARGLTSPKPSNINHIDISW